MLMQTETDSAVAANNNSTYFQRSKEKKIAASLIPVRNALQDTAHCTYTVEGRNDPNEASSEELRVACHCQMISDGISLGVQQDRGKDTVKDRLEMTDSLALS